MYKVDPGIRRFIVFWKVTQLGFLETVLSPEFFSIKPEMGLVAQIYIFDICIILTTVEFLAHSLKTEFRGHHALFRR